MATKNYTTKTASLRATKIDTNKIELKGKNILDYISENKTTVLDERGTNITENDLWGTTVATDANGVVTVSCKNVTNPNGSGVWNTEIVKVEDNKAYTGEFNSYYGTFSNLAFFANIQTDKIVDGNNLFYESKLIEFNSDLSNLTYSNSMFYNTSLSSFDRDLSSLTNGSGMFRGCSKLISFYSDLSSLSNGLNMFACCDSLAAFDRYLSSDLSSLTNGSYMFYSCNNLKSFNSDLSSLIDGSCMFMGCTSLSSFDRDLSSLVNGSYMFSDTSLSSFDRDLSSLVNGSYMFYNTSLTSFSGDLSSLVNGSDMFSHSSLASFSGDLSSLVNGSDMFSTTSLTSFSGDLSSLTNGGGMFYNCVALTTFQGNLGSLLAGFRMFTSTKLDIESIEYIADGIRDLAAEGLVKSSNGGKTWTVDTSTEEKWKIWNKIDSTYRTNISIGYDSTLYPVGSEGEAEIFALCNEMVSKGWRVYLDGSSSAYVPTDGAATTALDGEVTTTPISYWYKPVATEEEYASYVDADGNYFNIVGAQYVFGDDLSTYGQFTSLEEAELAIGLTKYVRPEVKEEE